MPLYFKKVALFGSLAFSATAFGQFVNKGLVGYTFLPADALDVFGDTVSLSH